MFHIARTMGFALLKDSWGFKNIEEVEILLAKFENNSLPHSVYKEALDVVMTLRELDEKSYTVPAMYFKNSVSQRNRNAKLRTSCGQGDATPD